MSARLQARFQEMRRQGRMGIIPFITTGYPSVRSTLALVPALAEAGADVIELGVPFSDPLADGPTIQRASFKALQGGVTLGTCLEVCAELRTRRVDVPLVLMGYYNPILSYGIPRFARDAAKVGVDGIIVADLPPEEASPLQVECLGNSIDVICLLAPTSTDERIRLACSTASGFIYCVSLTGVTGARQDLQSGVFQLINKVRQHTTLPIAVGFGISKRLHVEAISGYAEAAVVGSALIDIIETAPAREAIDRARDYIASLCGVATRREDA